MLPLTGLRVIELGQNLAGPYAGAVLALLGAEVVKVERPEGDDARGWGPPFVEGTSATFHAVNVGKQSVTVDFNDAARRTWLAEQIAAADIVVQNLRAGALDRFGLDAATLTQRHPRLIYCSLSAYGREGPMADLPGYEPIVQSFAGILSTTGAPDGPTSRVGVSLLDHGSGMWAVIGILAAVVRRQATGRGGMVDTSLFETALAWMTIHHANHAADGGLPRRDRAGNPMLVVFQAFAADDGDIVIAAANDRLFAKLVKALGRPELAARYPANKDRVAARATLVPEIAAIIRARPVDHWLEVLSDAGVPAAPINDLPAVLAAPQTAADGMIQPVPGSAVAVMGIPLSFDGVRPVPSAPAPKLGQHDRKA